MGTKINEHRMLKLPKGVKFSRDFINKMDSYFEPSDMFIKLSWLPVEKPTKSRVLTPFLVALFADRVKDLIRDIHEDMQSNQQSEIKPKFMVLFEYGHNEFIHAYILHELCVPDKYLYHFDLDWYAKKWYMPNYLFNTDIQCVGNITNIPHLFSEVIGINSKKKNLYVTEKLTNPRVNTNFKDTGIVLDTYNEYYERYAPQINAI